MKITDVDTQLVQSDCGRRWTHVYIATDEGVVGIGEATYSHKEPVVAQMVDALKDHVISRDPFETEAIYSALYGGARTAYHTGGVIFTSAISGIDQALWDIKGKVLNAPVCALLGGPRTAQVPVYSHFSGRTLNDMVQRIKAVTDQGFNAVKSGTTTSIAPGPRVTAKQLRELGDIYSGLQREFGATVRLMDDPHAAYEPASGLAIARQLEPHDLLFLEEPTIPEDPEGYARVRAGTSTPIAGSERLTNKYRFNDFFRAGAVDVAQPDVVYIGGITEMKKVAALAETYQVAVAPHNTKGPVGIMASAHVMAAIPNGLIMEMVAPDVIPWRNDVLRDPLLIEDGYLRIEGRPGLGVDLIPEKLKAHLIP